MFTLYHQGSSVCAAKVRIVHEKGLEWESEYIDVLKGWKSLFPPRYRAFALYPPTVDAEQRRTPVQPGACSCRQPNRTIQSSASPSMQNTVPKSGLKATTGMDSSPQTSADALRRR